jgi:hypothetical protein
MTRTCLSVASLDLARRLVPPPVPGREKLVGLAKAAGLGLAMTLLQITLACVLSGETDVSEAYLKLCQWDGSWFRAIVEEGYYCPPTPTQLDPGDVCFFPGYPLCAWALHRVTGLSPTSALLATAQLGCWGFWTYLFLFFRRWQTPRAPTLLGVLLIASHPAAFYLVAAYSEPLFLMGVLGFLYWASKGTSTGLWLAAGHGFLMTSTRMVGFALIVYPVIQLWLHAPRPRGRWLPALGPVAQPLAVAALASLGTLFYFAFCHVRFGHWDMYLKAEEAGWATHADYLAILSYKTYKLHNLVWRDGFLDPDWLSVTCVPTYALVGLVLLVLEWRWRRLGSLVGARTRAGLYTCATLLFYVAVAGKSCVHMCSMVRLVLPVTVISTLGLIHLLSHLGEGVPPRWHRGGRLALGAWIVAGFVCQVAFTHRFVHGLWVA